MVSGVRPRAQSQSAASPALPPVAHPVRSRAKPKRVVDHPLQRGDVHPRARGNAAIPAIPFVPAREAMPASLANEITTQIRSSPRARQCRIFITAVVLRQPLRPRARGNAPLQAGATHKKAPPPTARARLQKWSGMASVTVPSAAAPDGPQRPHAPSPVSSAQTRASFPVFRYPIHAVKVSSAQARAS